MEIEQDFSFEEILNTSKQDGSDCGFVALNITRDDVVEFMIKEQNSIEIRTLLALEIQNFFFLESTSYQSEWISKNFPLINSLLDRKGENIEAEIKRALELVDEMKQYLSEFMGIIKKWEEMIHTKIMDLNDLLGFKEENKKNFEELQTIFDEQSLENHHQEKFNEILTNKEDFKIEMNQFLSRRDVYLCYVINYYQTAGMMAFQLFFGENNRGCIIDLIARMKRWNIFVWVPTQEDKLEIQYQTQNGNLNLEIRHIKFNGINHYTKLKPSTSFNHEMFINHNNLKTIFGKIVKVCEEEFEEFPSNISSKMELKYPVITKDTKIKCVEGLLFWATTNNFEQVVKGSVFVDKSCFVSRSQLANNASS